VSHLGESRVLPQKERKSGRGERRSSKKGIGAWKREGGDDILEKKKTPGTSKKRPKLEGGLWGLEKRRGFRRSSQAGFWRFTGGRGGIQSFAKRDKDVEKRAGALRTNGAGFGGSRPKTPVGKRFFRLVQT